MNQDQETRPIPDEGATMGDSVIEPAGQRPLCDCKDCEDYKSLCLAVHGLKGDRDLMYQMLLKAQGELEGISVTVRTFAEELKALGSLVHELMGAGSAPSDGTNVDSASDVAAPTQDTEGGGVSG